MEPTEKTTLTHVKDLQRGDVIRSEKLNAKSRMTLTSPFLVLEQEEESDGGFPGNEKWYWKISVIRLTEAEEYDPKGEITTFYTPIWHKDLKPESITTVEVLGRMKESWTWIEREGVAVQKLTVAQLKEELKAENQDY